MVGLPLGWFVRLLPSRACSWSRFSTAAHTCLFEAACSFRRLADGLLARGLDPLACTDRGVAVLRRAVYATDGGLVRRLLAAGVDPEESAGEFVHNVGMFFRASALALALCAARYGSDGQIEMVRVLLGAGVTLELDSVDSIGQAPWQGPPEDMFAERAVLAALREERRARAAWGELRRAWVFAVVRPAAVVPA